MHLMLSAALSASVLLASTWALPKGGSELGWALPNPAPSCEVSRPDQGMEETSDVRSAVDVSVDSLAHDKGLVLTLRIRPTDGHRLTGLLCKCANEAVKGRFVGMAHGLRGIEARAGEKGAECVTHTQGIEIANETVVLEYSTKQSEAKVAFYCVLADEENKWWTVNIDK